MVQGYRPGRSISEALLLPSPQVEVLWLQATAGWELNSSFFKLDQSRQGFSSSVLQETEGRDTVCHICTCGRPLDSPPSYTNNCSKWKGSREITLNNRKLLSMMCFQKKVMIYSFCPQCLGKGVRDLEDN